MAAAPGVTTVERPWCLAWVALAFLPELAVRTNDLAHVRFACQTAARHVAEPNRRTVSAEIRRTRPALNAPKSLLFG